MNEPKQAPFKPYPFIERDLDVHRRPDGSILLRNNVPLIPLDETLPDMLARHAAQRPDAVWLAQRRGPERKWHELSYGQAKHQVDAFTEALLALRKTGRCVAVLSGNSLEHAVMGLAAMQAGMPYVPITPAYSLLTPTLETLQGMIDLLNPAVVFMQNGSSYARVIHGLQLPPDARFVCVDDAPDHPLVTLWHAGGCGQVTSAVNEAIASIRPDTVAKYLFTSGSTGQAKAVSITHKMLSLGVAMHQQIVTGAEQKEPLQLLDWLPWSHVAGGSIQFSTALASGGTIWTDDGKPAPGLFDETIRNLREISPTHFSSVPIGYTILVEALERDEALAASFFRNMRRLGYAGAKMPDSIFDRMQAVAVRTQNYRIPFVSAFGSTETSASVTFPYWYTESAGCIGLPHPGVELKLIPLEDQRYELRVRSEAVTPGYLNRPDATREAFDEEGFFLMGDAVQLVDASRPEEGLLFAGRVSEEFKLQSGVFVRVGALRIDVLEATDGLLSDAVVAGADQPYVALLAWPNVNACRLRTNMPEATAASLAASHWLRDSVRDALRHHNAQTSASSRRIHRVLLLGDMPDMGAGEITDKGYVNQRRVLSLRAHDIVRLFAEVPDPTIIEIDG